MPAAPTYPGVYIQEAPSGFRPIVGVPTAVSGWVDFFAEGPVDEPTELYSFADFERTFGGLHPRSEASYGIQQFFLNGGARAVVVRVTADDESVVPAIRATRASMTVGALTLEAISEGDWGNRLRAIVSTASSQSPTEFDLRLQRVTVQGGVEAVVAEERYLNLSSDANALNAADRVLGDESALAVVVQGALGQPSISGLVSGVIAVATPAVTTVADAEIELIDANGSVETRTLTIPPFALTALDEAAAELQRAIRASVPAVAGSSPVEFTKAVVSVDGDQIRVTPGSGLLQDARFEFPVGTGNPAGNLPHLLELRGTTDPSSTIPARSFFAGGDDGADPTPTEIIGSGGVEPPTGLYALRNADIVNLLCLPGVSTFASDADADTVHAEAVQFAEDMRAVYLMDPASGQTKVADFKTWFDDRNIRNANVAVHFPRVHVADPFDDQRPRSVGNSGTIAGLCSATDTNRGVWKAPAGVDARLRGVADLDNRINDAQNGILNPHGINCIRAFTPQGIVNWGARTTEGADALASQWKYLPVRRLALYIEETLFRNTKWVLFEPNDEPLWAQIRLSVGAFMNDLFKKGAFAGSSAGEAYFVACDSSTTTPLDQSRGVVNLVVGFAPVNPTEFLIITISQIQPNVEV